jgi:hypothetical protein
VARFCVLGSGLLRGNNPTIARFRAEVSSSELQQFGASNLQFAVVKRFARVSAEHRGDHGLVPTAVLGGSPASPSPSPADSSSSPAKSCFGR